MIQVNYGEHKDKIDELIYQHTGKTAFNVIYLIANVENTLYIEYDDDDVIGLVSYFKTKDTYNMVIAMSLTNVFSIGQWKIISRYIRKRDKEVRLNSDPSNETICNYVTKNGGYWDGDDIVFPFRKE